MVCRRSTSTLTLCSRLQLGTPDLYPIPGSRRRIGCRGWMCGLGAAGPAASGVHTDDFLLIGRDDIGGDPQVEDQELPILDGGGLPVLDDVEIGQGPDDDALTAGGR